MQLSSTKMENGQTCSEADAIERSARRFCMQSVGLLIVLLVGVTGWTVSVDPYWLWKTSPAWDKNVALSRKMRFGKPLQAMTRQPDVVFIGTSRVMRGLDPEVVECHQHTIYNFGINSLRMPEAEAFIKHLTHYTSTKHIVFGLDYIMFDGLVDSKPGFDASTGTTDFIVNGFCTSLISRDAITDAWTLHAQKQNSKNRIWKQTGLLQQRQMSQQKINQKLQTMGFRQAVISEQRFEMLERILEHCDTAGVEVSLFFSPVHARVLDAYQETGHWDNYLQVKQRVQQIAANHQVKLWDFGNYNAITTIPLYASNDYYFDTSHYTPKVGAEILRKLGFPVKPATDVLLQTAGDFGEQLNPRIMLGARRGASRE